MTGFQTCWSRNQCTVITMTHQTCSELAHSQQYNTLTTDDVYHLVCTCFCFYVDIKIFSFHSLVSTAADCTTLITATVTVTQTMICLLSVSVMCNTHWQLTQRKVHRNATTNKSKICLEQNNNICHVHRYCWIKYQHRPTGKSFK